jgi:hypothetical protein
MIKLFARHTRSLSPAWRTRTPSPEKCQPSLGLTGYGGRGSLFIVAAIWSDCPTFLATAGAARRVAGDEDALEKQHECEPRVPLERILVERAPHSRRRPPGAPQPFRERSVIDSMVRGGLPFNRLELDLQPIVVARPRIRAEIGIPLNDRRPGGRHADQGGNRQPLHSLDREPAGGC